MIKKSTLKKVGLLEDFAFWIAEEVLNEEMWELNAVANGELIARKLVKCGVLVCEDGYYHFNKKYHTAVVELISENRRGKYKTIADRRNGEKVNEWIL